MKIRKYRNFPPSVEKHELEKIDSRRITYKKIAITETTAAHIGFPFARKIAKLETIRIENGKETSETFYLITSRVELTPKEIIENHNQYWSIENSLHYRLDVSLKEDDSLIRKPRNALVLAIIRRFAVSCAISWIQSQKRKKGTTRFQSTQWFFDHMKENAHENVINLIKARKSAPWISR